jgi:hypothetical protein
MDGPWLAVWWHSEEMCKISQNVILSPHGCDVLFVSEIACNEESDTDDETMLFTDDYSDLIYDMRGSN